MVTALSPGRERFTISDSFIGPIFWDLDGTIMDSLPGILETIEHTLGTLGHPVPENLRRWAGPPFPHSLRTELKLSEDEIEVAVATYRDYYNHTGTFRSEPFAGVSEIITLGHRLGRHQATATSKPVSQAKEMLRRQGLLDAFHAIGAASDDEKRSAKSDVLHDALDELTRLGVSLDHAVMVGDRIHDFEAAAERGLPCIAVTWGYGSENEWAHATYVVDTPAQLSELLALPLTDERV